MNHLLLNKNTFFLKKREYVKVSGEYVKDICHVKLC